MTLPIVTLHPTATVANAPFCLGHGFVKGEVPAGSQIVAPFADFQCVPKNTWPDGSLKYAILSGRVGVVANTPLPIQLSIGVPDGSGVVMAGHELNTRGVVASIACGAFGTATWSGADWDTPFVSWISGKKMSSFIYRKPVGTDAHLVAWLEVRVWAGGEIEVLPWIENGYLKVAAPTNKNATYSFTLGGIERVSVAINLLHHQRTPLINGSALSYWVGTDPAVTAVLDPVYLQLTELVPTYIASLPANAARVAAQVATYVPLQAGNISYADDSQAGPGFQRPIGLLPEHDILFLVAHPSNRAALVQSVQRNGYSAGRYALNYRDENTFRPLRFSQRPMLNIGDSQGFKDSGGSNTGERTPAPTGGNPPGWDVAHHPSVGFMAYLLSGRWYHMEQVQLAAVTCYLGNGTQNVLRDGSKGLVQPCAGAWQTRSTGWDWRTRTQALCVTPDDDTDLRNEFISSVQHNIDHFYNRYVAQPNNPFGWIGPNSGSYQSGTLWDAPWMQDFVTAAFGYSISLGLPIPTAYADKLLAFFKWKAKSVVGRLGTSASFWYINAPYTIKVSDVENPDFVTGTGPWLADWKTVYDQSFAVPPVWFGTTEGVLAQEISPGAMSMRGNLQPAIAYAVRHNVAGAVEGLTRLTSATNWPAFAADFNNFPGWGVKPSLATSSTGTTIVTTPGPSAVFDVAPLLGAGTAVFDSHRGHGLPIAEVPIGGTDGVGLLRRVIEVNDNPQSELRLIVNRYPTLGTLVFDGLGGYTYTGAADSFDYSIRGDGGLLGSATETLVAAATGGGTTPAPTVTSVSISPTTATGSQTFVATVNGLNNPSQGLTWSKVGNGALVGGVFVAPAQTNAVQTVTIRATSTLDPSKFAEAVVTIPAAVVTPGSVVTGVTVLPANAVIAAGATQTFTHVVNGTGGPSQAVTRTTSVGTINSSGVLTAPPGSVGVVTFTSDQNPSIKGTASFSVAMAGDIVVAPNRVLRTEAGGLVGVEGGMGDYKLSGRSWYIAKDPDDSLYYARDLKQDLLASSTTIKTVVALVNGVVLAEAARIQGTVVLAKINGGTAFEGEAPNLTFRVTCNNGEQFDRSVYFNIMES